MNRNPASAFADVRMLCHGVVAMVVCFAGSCSVAGSSAAVLSEARNAFDGRAFEVAAGVLDRLLSSGNLQHELLDEARLLRARIALEKGDAASVEALLAGSEAKPEAALVLAMGALQSERWWVASERFEAATAQGADPLPCAMGRATALARLGRETEALAALRALAGQEVFSKDGPLLLALAGLHLDIGEVREAGEVLSQIQPSNRAQSAALSLLQARYALAEGRVQEAAGMLAPLFQPGFPVPAEVIVGAYLTEAGRLELSGASPAAAKLLLQFLKSGCELPCAEPLYERAAHLLSELADPPVGDLEACTRSGSQNQRALASFYLARFYAATGKDEKAAAVHEVFCQQHREHRLFPVSLLHRAEVLMGGEQWDKAEALLAEALGCCEEPGLAAVLQMRRGLALLRMDRFEMALACFEGVAQSGSDFKVEAVFNAGLTAVRMGDLRRARKEQERLGTFAGTAELVASLELEAALFLAGNGKPEAHEALQAFLRAHPGHPRLAEAKVALSELLLREAEAAAGGSRAAAAGAMRGRASELLKAVAVDQQSPQSAIQAKYLAVFLADADGNSRPEEVLAMGEDFLREHPESPLAREMRMKLGEIYFRRKDFANAEEQFARVAAGQSESALGETALFLAGQCAASRLNPGSVDDALRYWEKVAQGNGALRWRARYQQAAVKSRIGDDADGAELFGRIIRSSDPIELELRLAARCGRADALLALSKRGAVPIGEALAEYEALAVLPEVTPLWRNQALHKKAKALEQAQQQEALEGFCRVLDAPGSVEAGEFFWLFKSGFDAARILEGRKAWRDAAALYERLGRIGGPRAGEARHRASQIRLEHFLWD
jgi:tetratricopeptide (TPR) repeat protein